VIVPAARNQLHQPLGRPVARAHLLQQGDR
jgi:hypothetical protein